MTQRLAAGATHGRCEGDGALQWAVLLTAASASEDYGTEPGSSHGGRRSGEAAVHSKLQPFQPTGTLEASNCLEMLKRKIDIGCTQTLQKTTKVDSDKIKKKREEESGEAEQRDPKSQPQ